jgi:hypothetical protein
MKKRSSEVNPKLSKEASHAFDTSIKTGHLSLDGRRKNFIGNYMYMGKVGKNPNTGFLFKNQINRKYVGYDGEYLYE